MNNQPGNMPIIRVSIRRKEGEEYKSYSVASVWRTKYDELLRVNLDKGSEKFPAMGPIEAIKAFAMGGTIEIRTSKPKPAAIGGSSFSDDSDAPF